MKRFITIAISTLCLGLAAQPLRLGAFKGPSALSLAQVVRASLEGDSGAPSVSLVASPDQMAARLSSGELDVAAMPPNLAAKLNASGLRIRALAVIGYGMVYLIKGEGTSLPSFGALKGSTLPVAGQGATPDFLTRLFLSKAGLEAGRDVELSFKLPYPEMAAALAAGKIDMAVLPEPFATQALLANPRLSIAFDYQALWKQWGRGGGNYPMTLLVARAEVIEKRPAELKALLASCEASIAWVNAKPDEAASLAEKLDLGFKAAAARASIPRANFGYAAFPSARAELDALLRVFLELDPKSIGGSMPDEAFYAAIP
jgi:NitT/TauT family transport system substrate-binding protein